jgi:type IX secretion system PorP/SprF family membrane protein
MVFITKYLPIGILLCFILGEPAQAQDPEFTQFYANPLYLNPAFAGTVRCPRIALNYRNQWPSVVNGSFVTYSASYDQHIDALKGGIGLLAMSDKEGRGILSTTSVSGIYSYQLNVTRKFSIKAGAEARYLQKSIDWSKLTFGDMIDERRGFIYNSAEQPYHLKRTNVDFSAGLLGYSKKYFFGAAFHHLTQPEEGFLQVNGPARLPMKYTFHAGAVFPLDKKESSISPNILYQQQQDFQQLNLGLYLNKGAMVGGLWYRVNDAVIVLIGFQQQLIKFAYSYDLTVSKLVNSTSGAHELSFAYQFECKPKKRKFRTVSCPSF